MIVVIPPPDVLCVNGECVPVVCDNDGICEFGEDRNTFPNDCISGIVSVCSNGVCEPGEGCVSCPEDCNGKQKGKLEDRFCCGGDYGLATTGGITNQVGCSDLRCSSDGFLCTSIPSDYFCCGDYLYKSPNEDKCNCAIDCGEPPTSEEPNYDDSIDSDL